MTTSTANSGPARARVEAGDAEAATEAAASMQRRRHPDCRSKLPTSEIEIARNASLTTLPTTRYARNAMAQREPSLRGASERAESRAADPAKSDAIAMAPE